MKELCWWLAVVEEVVLAVRMVVCLGVVAVVVVVVVDVVVFVSLERALVDEPSTTDIFFERLTELSKFPAVGCDLARVVQCVYD